VPQRGAVTIETLHGGDVLGWSWLVPPHRTVYDARALGVVRTIALDGACLRGKCEEDPRLGYELLKRFTEVIVERLQATRLRLLDVYGQVPAR
jgi:CRP/FNR family cyclic AMP-dependent transcriptional regulator